MINSRTFSRIALTFVSLAVIAWGSACQSSDSGNADAANTAARSNSNAGAAAAQTKDDVSELLNIVRLPEIPEEVVWREEPRGAADDRAPGPTDQKLVAVLKYDNETAAKLIAQIEKNKQPEAAESGRKAGFPKN